MNHWRALRILNGSGGRGHRVYKFATGVRGQLDEGDLQVGGLLNFAGAEAKHIQLFRQFHPLVSAGFGILCAVIGPAHEISAEILRHDPLAVSLLILHIEWMSQRHYVESIRESDRMDPLFKSLLKHHWMEEAQHAKIDTLMVEALAAGRDERSIKKPPVETGGFLDQSREARLTGLLPT